MQAHDSSVPSIAVSAIYSDGGLLKGNPTKAQLAAGIGKRGAPVSEHNVRVDYLCTEAGKRFMLAGVR